MKFPRLTSSDQFIQSNLDIGYLKADMEELRKEWERRTAHLLPRPEWREPITRERTWKVI